MDAPSVILGNMFGSVQLVFPNMHNATPGVAPPTPELKLPPPIQTFSCDIEAATDTLTLSYDGAHMIFTR